MDDKDLIIETMAKHNADLTALVQSLTETIKELEETIRELQRQLNQKEMSSVVEEKVDLVITTRDLKEKDIIVNLKD